MLPLQLLDAKAKQPLAVGKIGFHGHGLLFDELEEFVTEAKLLASPTLAEILCRQMNDFAGPGEETRAHPELVEFLEHDQIRVLKHFLRVGPMGNQGKRERAQTGLVARKQLDELGDVHRLRRRLVIVHTMNPNPPSNRSMTKLYRQGDSLTLHAQSPANIAQAPYFRHKNDVIDPFPVIRMTR